MKLDGAEVKNIYGLCSSIGSGEVNSNLRVRIPYYQRPYKWTAPYIENLFSDFFQNLEDNKEKDKDKEYFIGSVVLVKTDKSDYYEVVDGQQRTTTVFLLNYLKFLLLRSYIEELLATKKISKIEKAIDNLCGTLNMLVVLDKEEVVFSDYCESISDKLDLLDGNQDDEDKELEKLLNEYRSLFGLPVTKDLSDKNIYAKLFNDELSEFITKYTLTLSYDRNSYNDLLKQALSLPVVIFSNSNKPEMLITGSVEEESPLAVYVEAIKTEFKWLIEHTDKNLKPADTIIQIISDIDCMLQNLNFCKILTGNEQDAYTLFEVLNDRAMVVDDLELVKNMFFKKYCNSSVDKESQKDKNIEELDDLWGDVIFHGAGVMQTQLIAYCTSVYLTGTTELVTNKGQRYRDVLQEKYLNGKKSYEFEDVYHDFQIFQIVRLITDKFKLKYMTPYKYGIIAENDINKSIVYKTVNLIHAMDYKAVMPAMVNVIISCYLEKNNSKKIDIKSFESYLDELITGNNANEYTPVYECASILRKAVLLGSSYSIPRDIARNIIEHNNNGKLDSSAIVMTAENQKQLKKEFFEWTKNWRYGSDKQNFKVKVLFLNLYQAEKNEKILSFKTAKFAFSSDIDVALDHLDAQNPDLAAEEKYFKPVDSYDVRSDYVDSLGNMMILDGKNNGDKNNKPLCRALEYHKRLADHWLINEIEKMLNDDEFSKEVESGSEKFRVANEKFFTDRTHRLQEYFYAVVNRNLGENAVNIGE